MPVYGQLLILMGITVLGEVLSAVCHIPVPGNVLGMLCMLILLGIKWIKEAHVADVGDFLLQNMAFVFVPSVISIIENIGRLEGVFIRVLLLCIGTTLVTLVATGATAQFVIRVQNRCKKEAEPCEK